MTRTGIISMAFELIQADLAFDLWDIDGGEIPGQMASGEIVVGIVDKWFGMGSS